MAERTTQAVPGGDARTLEESGVTVHARAAGIEQAAGAASTLFDDPRAEVYEPSGPEECEAAVAALADRFAEGGGTLREMVDNARAGARLMSSDRLQGVSEIVQNADDVQATQVTFVLSDDSLLAMHNGKPAHLRNIHALAAPWLTTKVEDDAAAGRFGVGLSTLHSLADWFEFSSGDYHVRLGDPTLSPLPARALTAGETEIRVPLKAGLLGAGDLLKWAAAWDETSLLFLRHVRTVAFIDNGERRTLHLEMNDAMPARRRVGGRTIPVSRTVATATDGRSWTVERAAPRTPKDLRRSHKSTGATTTIGVALPHQNTRLEPGAPDAGALCARLPLIGLAVPVFLDGEFDPTTGRQMLADTPWNAAVAGLVVDLWTAAVADFFVEAPEVAWHAVPTNGPELPEVLVDAARTLERRLSGEACAEVGRSIVFSVDGDRVPLGSLAYEAQGLTGLITDEEVCALVGVEHALATHQRDRVGRWRRVLEAWQHLGVTVPQEVTVPMALQLAATLPDGARADAIVTAAINAEDVDLRHTAWVRLTDDRRITPPQPTGLPLLTRDPAGAQLALGVGAHIAYSDDGARTIVDWLAANSTLDETMSVESMLAHLARAGLQPECEPISLADHDLARLRAALEALPRSERQRLGTGIGRALTVDAFRYAPDGAREVVSVTPADAYLPPQIDRDQDSFAVAARNVPGPTWIDPRYQGLLRSPRGRDGLGARAMLTALGARTVPRFAEHSARELKYGSRRSLRRDLPGSPAPRTAALTELSAEVSLDDLESPDLEAVLIGISVETDPQRRRRRARAALATLNQVWPQVADDATVDGATGYYEWQPRGTVPSWWLAKIQDTPWLDDATGTPRRPVELRQPTPANEAVYGQDPTTYVHADLEPARFVDVLHELGVSGEPTDLDLVARLRDLRHSGVIDDSAHQRAASIYAVLSSRMAPSRLRGSSDLSRQRLRQMFTGERLLLTANGWFAPADVFRGPPVFGAYRPSVPQIPNGDALWAALVVPLPTIGDCVEVVRQLARKTTDEAADQAVHLDVLRLLTRLLEPAKTPQPVAKLGRLPVRTHGGWTRDRPLYAVDDPLVASRLGERIPVWDPGGDIAQFRSLLAPLRITELPEPGLSNDALTGQYDDDALTALFHSTVEHIRDDLARNDPKRHASITTPWDEFTRFRVVVAPRLSVDVHVPNQPGTRVQVEVNARLELAEQSLHLRDPEDLQRADGAGRAIATLFETDRRTMTHAWVAAAQAALELRDFEAVRTAEEVAKDEMRNAEQLGQHGLQILQADARSRAQKGRRPDKRPPSQAPTSQAGDAPTPAEGRTRVLVELADLTLVDPSGQIVTPLSPPAPKRPQPKSRPDGLPEPAASSPKAHSTARAYTELEKETLALELLKWALGSDDARLVDLRAQRNVGADAIDDLRRFFELKVSGTAEPERVRLEPSQVQRALEVGEDFFLVVVSGLEGENATPRVRIIDRPLDRLQLTSRTLVEYAGVAGAGGLVFDFGRAEGAASDDDAAAR